MWSALPAPTKAEKLRMDLIVEGGCVCCLQFAGLVCLCEVHHLTVGGKHGAPRLGHAHTVGLCVWHHRGNPYPWPEATMAGLVGPSYAREPSEFRRVFGGDEGLLRLQSARLAVVVSWYLIPPGRYADPALPGGFGP
jgi:hypothetical protein